MPLRNSAKVGVLLLNLGTPENPTALKVGEYLREFLMDPFVLDIPWLFRWFLVNVMIVPRRSHESALLYQKIWGADGSPLLSHTLELARAVQQELGDRVRVKAGMRYGEPSVLSALRALRDEGVGSLVVFPLYPQYSLAATESSVAHAKKMLKREAWSPSIHFIPAFYNDESYLSAVAAVSALALKGKTYDRYLFSFHGLPERQVKKTDLSGNHCLKNADCCDRITAVNSNCYRAQCHATAREIALRLKIPAEQYSVCFQSRLGKTPWITPYTDGFYRELPKQGVKNIAVFCPSFVADCLETLEEVRLRGEDEFKQHGGESIFLVPSLNASPVWSKSVGEMIKRVAPHLFD